MFKQIRTIIVLSVLVSFICSSIQIPAYAQIDPMPFMPQPGVMVLKREMDFQTAFYAFLNETFLQAESSGDKRSWNEIKATLVAISVAAEHRLAVQAWDMGVRHYLESGQLQASLKMIPSPNAEDVLKEAKVIWDSIADLAMTMPDTLIKPMADQSSNYGGIDLNSANLAMTIKRDGNGVPLPLAQQDLAQLSNIEGLDPVILSITPASQTPLFAELVAH